MLAVYSTTFRIFEAIRNVVKTIGENIMMDTKMYREYIWIVYHINFYIKTRMEEEYKKT
jgi:hypothetical protein